MDSSGNKEASSHEQGSSGAVKSPRAAVSNDNVSNNGGELTLPPEVWAGVMECLPFQNVLACSAVCRSLLHDTMPLLKTLRIDKASEINYTVASRFRDVREIQINSLLCLNTHEEGTIHEFTDVGVDDETKMRLLPYLSRFDKLETVFFGGIGGVGQDITRFFPAGEAFWEGDESYPAEGSREKMLAFIDTISSAFRSRALSKNLMISGLCCPDSTDNRSHGSCRTCQSACKSFPLDAVVHFECRGSSKIRARSGRSYGLDVCLEMAEIESIVESRPGGHILLRSDQRLLRLVGSGTRYEIVSGDKRALHIVKFNQKELNELKRFIAYSALDVKRLSPQAVYEAVMKSFANGKYDSIPPKEDCLLSDDSVDHLIDTLGFELERSAFDCPLADHHLQPIVQAMVQRHDEDIEIDCLRLIRRFLEQRDPPIEQIINALPRLADFLKRTSEFQLEAATSLKIVLKEGTEEHIQIVIDAGVISAFAQLLKSSDDSITECAVSALDGIVSDGASDIIEELVNADALPRLVQLLDSKLDIVGSAMRVLAVATKDHIEEAVEAGVLRHIARFVSSPDHVDMLKNCSVLLRRSLETDDPPIQQVLIDLDMTSMLVRTMQSNKDPSIQVNLAHVMIKLVSRASGIELEYALVAEPSCINILVSLLHWPDEEGVIDIVNKATAAIEIIASISPKYRDQVVQTGVMDLLLRSFQQSSETTIIVLDVCNRSY